MFETGLDVLCYDATAKKAGARGNQLTSFSNVSMVTRCYQSLAACHQGSLGEVHGYLCLGSVAYINVLTPGFSNFPNSQ